VTLFYDPLLAKLIAWGETREIAIQRMRRALTELVIVGLPTSQPFHLRVMDDAEFLEGEIDIKYLERAGARVLAAPPRAAWSEHSRCLRRWWLTRDMTDRRLAV